jgi:hypothetical protein
MSARVAVWRTNWPPPGTKSSWPANKIRGLALLNEHRAAQTDYGLMTQLSSDSIRGNFLKAAAKLSMAIL